MDPILNENAQAYHIDPIPLFCRSTDFPQRCHEIDIAIRRGDEQFLCRHLRRLKKEGFYQVNLSGDPLLSVVIAYEKMELAQKLLEVVQADDLLHANLQGNNAFHVAAAVGDGAMGIAEVLVKKHPQLLNERNEDHETPLLRAALYGQRCMFWKLFDLGGAPIIDVKRKDGANVLHCAIMGNSPRLALEIARKFPNLTTRRNTAGVTPLQLVVTIPGAFKSKMQFGQLEAFIYQCEKPLCL